MREAEMADLKKSFDEVKEAATGFASGDIMTSLHNDVTSALGVDEKPAAAAETVASSDETASLPAEAAASEPLAIAPEVEPASAVADAHSAATETAEPSRDAKAS
jgi:sec-independent protein translocase protein TatB